MFRSLCVCCGGCPLACCLPLVLVLVTAPGRCTEAAVLGRVVFSPDETHIAQLSPGGFARFRERTSTFDRAVSVTPVGDGSLSYSAMVSGRTVPFDAAMQSAERKLLTALGRDKVAGKVVLFNVHYDVRKAQTGFAFDAYGEAVVYRGNGGKAVAALGGAASLVRSIGAAEYRLPHTGFSYPAPIPAAALAAEDADLVEHLAAHVRHLPSDGGSGREAGGVECRCPDRHLASVERDREGVQPDPDRGGEIERHFERQFAVKVLHPDLAADMSVARFEREVESVSRVMPA